MKEIRFLSLAEIEMIHEDQIKRYGGIFGIRDLNLVSSAIALPESQFNGEYLHHDIYAMASAYAFHLCQNHPFIDGNKRVALASALVFLSINGIEINDPDEVLYEAMIGVASSHWTKQQLYECFLELAKSSHK